ncbi:MAG: NfeD family protein [Fervidicoccaceae archaeon]|jgi:membrane-bound serine protease (ClpP class)
MNLAKLSNNEIARASLIIIILFSLLNILTGSSVTAQGQSTNVIGQKVVVIQISGVIDTAMEDYVSNALSYSESQNAILVIELNTPGGLLDSAMNIVTMIDSSKVPVVGYVVNRWAESAGTMILVSCHIAAMQPGTIIGSMQPIEYNPTTGEYSPTNESKIINPILTFLDEHAGNKGRNMTAIHLFVTENLNLGANSALEDGVINYVAPDLNSLLQQMNGTSIYVPGFGGNYTLYTAGASVEYFGMSIRHYLVHVLSDPTISTLLLSLGMMILLFTIISGHLAVTPIGLLMMLLGFLGSGYSISATSLLLILLGVILIFIEHAVLPGFGIVGATGIIMLVLGIALMPTGSAYSFSQEYASTFLYAAYGIGIAFGSFTAFVVYKILKVRRKKPFEWKFEGLRGTAIDLITPEREGFIKVHGEYWKARSKEHEIKPGESVVVLAKEGPILIVERIEEEQSNKQ